MDAALHEEDLSNRISITNSVNSTRSLDVTQVKQQFSRNVRVCILGSRSIHNEETEELLALLSPRLTQEFCDSHVFITTGLSGVQECFAQHFGRDGKLLNLIPFGFTSGFENGEDMAFGRDSTQVLKGFEQVGEIYIAFEGGPGLVREVAEALRHGALVIPVMRTGGAVAGQFGFPPAALRGPKYVDDDDWELLRDKDAKVEDCVEAIITVLRIFTMRALLDREDKAKSTGNESGATRLGSTSSGNWYDGLLKFCCAYRAPANGPALDQVLMPTQQLKLLK